MKIYYPLDKFGNQIGFITPESYVYDKTGKNLTDKIEEINSTTESVKIEAREIFDSVEKNMDEVNSSLKLITKSCNPLYEAMKTIVSDHYLDDNGIYNPLPTGTYHCSSATFVDVNRTGFLVKVSEGYNFRYFTYDSNLVATYDSTWLTGECFLPVGKIRISFKKIDDTVITSEEAINCIDVYDNNPVYDRYLTPLLVGNGYIDFDSINNIMTIPADTLIIKSDSQTKYISISPVKLYINYSDMTSSAIKFMFNINEGTVTAHKYNEVLSDVNNHILIAVIRSPHTGWVNEFKISINAPYSINGRPYGITHAVPNKNVKSVAHRGYSKVAPENTLAAYRLSKFFGFDYVETDIQFTSDNIPVCIHDDTIDRTSSATGNISDLTYEYVRTLDFGSWKAPQFAGEKIPSLIEFIIVCRDLGLHPYIEFKNDTDFTQDRVNMCMDIVKRHGMIRNCTWISFNPDFLGYAKNYDSKARLGFLVSNIDDSTINTIKSLQTTANEVFINAAYTEVTTAQIDLVASNNIPLEVWSVDEKADITTLDRYITGMTTSQYIVGTILTETELQGCKYLI